MDLNTINGVIRALLPAALAWAVGRGWIPATAITDITAAAVAVAAAWWSIKSNKPAA